MTNGKPTRVAMRDSITNRVCNNFSMKLPGLVPTATGAWISASMLNTDQIYQGAQYPFTSSCNTNNWRFYPIYGSGLLYNSRYVGPQTRINGMYVL